MNLLFLIVLVAQLNNIQTSDVLVETLYTIEDGQFLLIEQYNNFIVLNEYPSFYSKKTIPLGNDC